MKEVIIRNILNIIDVKNSYTYDKYLNDHLFDHLHTYINNSYDNLEMINVIHQILVKHKDTIDQLENNKINHNKINLLLEDLRQWKRNYFINKE